MPKCDAGRWGSVHDVEARLLRAGGDKIGQCFRKVLAEKVKSRGEGPGMEPIEHDELNQLSVEQNVAFRRMMG
eukprot:2723257-Lingulodinium_polyedra.AAC.1